MKYALLALVLGITLAACEGEQPLVSEQPAPTATASETPAYLP